MTRGPDAPAIQRPGRAVSPWPRGRPAGQTRCSAPLPTPRTEFHVHARDKHRTAPARGPVRRRDGQRAAGGPASLQRAVGNTVVTRMLARGGAVQRAEGAQEAAGAAQGFQKISGGGHIALRGRQEAYASAEMFAEANTALEALERVAVTLERGTPVDVGGRRLYRVLPVYKNAAAVKEPAKAGHEPVRGDSPGQRGAKHAAYRASLARPPEFEELNSLVLEVNKRLAGWFEPADSTVADARARAMRLSTATVGGGWTAEEFPYPERFGRKGLEDLKGFLPKLAAAYATQITAAVGAEERVDELLVTLPNDCQAAAHRLIGRPDDGLSAVRPHPAVGENHFADLTGAAPDGWANHFAAVVMRDGPDTLTYEAAADRNAPLQQGKSLGYFALYGAPGTDTSFAAAIGAQNQAYSDAARAGSARG